MPLIISHRVFKALKGMSTLDGLVCLSLNSDIKRYRLLKESAANAGKGTTNKIAVVTLIANQIVYI